MINLISLILLTTGTVLVFIPEKTFKRFNNAIVGILLAGVGMTYIFGHGLVESIKIVIDLIKGWI